MHLLLVCVWLAAIALGVPLSPFALTVLVLLAALPSASNVSLLAEKFGAQRAHRPHHFGVHRPGVCELLGCGGTPDLSSGTAQSNRVF